MEESVLVRCSKDLAIGVIRLTEAVRRRNRFFVVIDQLLRSGTSIGANIHEGNYGASRADYIYKFQIALKECYETEYWLEIFQEPGVISSEEFEDLYGKCSRIRRMLSASIRTAKKNGRE